MNYTEINRALAKEFGKGQVELRKAKNNDLYKFTLWFLSDDPDPVVVQKAKRIVGKFEPCHWFDDLRFHSTSSSNSPTVTEK